MAHTCWLLTLGTERGGNSRASYTLSEAFTRRMGWRGCIVASQSQFKAWWCTRVFTLGDLIPQKTRNIDYQSTTLPKPLPATENTRIWTVMIIHDTSASAWRDECQPILKNDATALLSQIHVSPVSNMHFSRVGLCVENYYVRSQLVGCRLISKEQCPFDHMVKDIPNSHGATSDTTAM